MTSHGGSYGTQGKPWGMIILSSVITLAGLGGGVYLMGAFSSPAPQSEEALARDMSEFLESDQGQNLVDQMAERSVANAEPAPTHMPSAPSYQGKMSWDQWRQGKDLSRYERELNAMMGGSSALHESIRRILLLERFRVDTQGAPVQDYNDYAFYEEAFGVLQGQSDEALLLIHDLQSQLPEGLSSDRHMLQELSRQLMERAAPPQVQSDVAIEEPPQDIPVQDIPQDNPVGDY